MFPMWERGAFLRADPVSHSQLPAIPPSCSFVVPAGFHSHTSKPEERQHPGVCVAGTRQHPC